MGSKKGRKLNIRMSDEDILRLHQLSLLTGLSISDYVRRAIEVKAGIDASVRNASEGVQ